MKLNFDFFLKSDRERTADQIIDLINSLIAWIIIASTQGVVVAVTIVVTLSVILFGGWWLYTALPIKTFYIVAAVLAADVFAGVLIRKLYSKRTN